MASAPLNLPRPTFRDRVVSAVSGFLGGPAAIAQPTGNDPLAGATPQEDAAPPKTGEKEVYSRAYGGMTLDPRWLQQLALIDDKILFREGSQNLELWDAILDDPTCKAAFQQRQLAVVSKPWEVEPGDDSALAQQAADHIRDQLKNVPWDRICEKMLFSLWYGYGVAEALFDYGEDGKVKLSNVLVPDRKWFAFTNAGELRLRSAEQEQEALPPNKFWTIRSGASHDFAHYGVGLAHWCYWPVWFKKNAIKFWAIYLEKFGMPTVLGKFPTGSDTTVQDNLLNAAAEVGRSAAVIVPIDTELELMDGGRTSDSTYSQFCNQMDDALMRVILSQTGTSKSEAQGLGGSQSDVMKDVRDEVVASDSDLLHESFNGSIVTWLTRWNFGPNCPLPRVYRNLEPEEDLTAQAATDKAISELGWERTEDSFAETYGEGYQKKKIPPPLTGVDPVTGKTVRPEPGSNVVPIDEARRARASQFAAFATGPQPLYVSRQLEAASARELLHWAREQGIPGLEPASELHVTVLYSRTAVDWFDMGSDWQSDPAGRLRIPPGGPRAVEKFGEDCIVLRFASSELKWRHDSMVERGASHDFEEYAPHITLAKDLGFDPAGIEQLEPFQGELVFGPEIFGPIREGDGLTPELSEVFSAEQLDHIDRWAAALADESEPMVAEFAASLKGKLAGVTSPEALRVVLLDALERFPAERLGELAGVSYTASRAAAQAGETDQLAV